MTFNMVSWQRYCDTNGDGQYDENDSGWEGSLLFIRWQGVVMDQGMVNTIITLAGGIFGWLLKTLWDSVRMLEKTDDMIIDKVNRVEVLVAGEYVRREEFQDGVQRLFTKLDQIEAKIDQKADK